MEVTADKDDEAEVADGDVADGDVAVEDVADEDFAGAADANEDIDKALCFKKERKRFEPLNLRKISHSQ